ncbi:hypothetical protein E2976_00030 (plasmid) [Paracoccus yeei]|uniref:hypothetical protein n=1 Tax=Paracoccus yeei TaxID=147645 RepID=UPI003BF84B2E
MKTNNQQLRTANGLQVSARQRAHQSREVETGEAIIHQGRMGELIVNAAVGGQRGYQVTVSISLDEILAWLPYLVRRAKSEANMQGFREAEAENGKII